MSKSKFDDYHQNIIIPNRHRINILRLSNPFTTNIVFSPPNIILKFVQLETLVLDNIDATYLKNILNHSIHLPKLHSLSLNIAVFIKHSTDVFLQIFRLPKLKYCKLNFQAMDHLNLSSTSTNILSPIEHLIIKPFFPFESFNNLLSYLPRLRHLSIDLVHSGHHKEIDFSPLVLKSFKYVSLKLYSMNLNRLEQIIKNYFHYIEVFRITSSDDRSYLNAKKWEQIILSYMPNLRIFDIQCGFGGNCHDLMNEFNSSFWVNKQWFFSHQHTWKNGPDSGIFYSINPYRRKHYTLYWRNNEQTCSYIEEKIFNSMKHVHIGGKPVTNNSIHYFPNQTDSFQYVSTTNKVKYLDIYQETCTLEKFQIIRNLFHQLEYLQIGMSKDEIKQFIHFLYSKTNDKTHPLSLLYIFQERKKSISELNRLMRSEDLHEDYLIKTIDCGSYLWW